MEVNSGLEEASMTIHQSYRWPLTKPQNQSGHASGFGIFERFQKSNWIFVRRFKRQVVMLYAHAYWNVEGGVNHTIHTTSRMCFCWPRILRFLTSSVEPSSLVTSSVSLSSSVTASLTTIGKSDVTSELRTGIANVLICLKVILTRMQS